MTQYWRNTHWRTSVNGDHHSVNGHWVNREHWDRYGFSEDREYLIQKEIKSFENRPFDDFTRSTTCPICGATVYFVRHNGGCVWLDSLGWPWPKHPCFDDPNEVVFLTTKTELDKLKVDYFGIVIETGPNKKSDTYKFKIRCSNNKIVEALFEYHDNAKDWIGQLVIVNKGIINVTIDNIFLSKLTGKLINSERNQEPKPLGQLGEALRKAME
jgi:hypothetical protein